MNRLRGVVCGLCVSLGAWAQMPHEILLLVNKRSQPSLKVANVFVETRQIPRRNMVHLDITESVYGGNAAITPEQFTKLIWEPANTVAQARGIDKQILAWVYSVDFPIRVKTDVNERKQISVGGMTFVRNKALDPGLIEKGTFLSKLFAGPNQQFKLTLNSMSLGMQKKGIRSAVDVPPEAAWLQQGLGDHMPLPSMMLGYIGENGTDLQTVLDTIDRGKKSDFRGLHHGIYFITNDDIRSTCREWQFVPAAKELKQRGIAVQIATNFPVGARNVMGILMGAAHTIPSQIASFAPGAMAEHLTSWSAEFQKPQTKMTEWLAAGATASAGAVVEPYSNPNKFPSARFFVHYTSGCSLLESFFQSIACPLQTLLLGDPFARPYAVPISVKIFGMETLTRDFTYVAYANIRAKNARFLYSFFLDGKEFRPVSKGNLMPIRLKNLSDGYHTLRAVARVRNMVEFSASAEKQIMVKRLGRSINILPSISRIGKYEHILKVQIGGSEKPEKLRLVSGELMLDERDYNDEAELVFDELMTGEGPNRLRAVAVFSDGMEVSSPPINLTVVFSEHAGIK